jgi:hypothetical protein
MSKLSVGQFVRTPARQLDHEAAPRCGLRAAATCSSVCFSRLDGGSVRMPRRVSSRACLEQGSLPTARPKPFAATSEIPFIYLFFAPGLPAIDGCIRRRVSNGHSVGPGEAGLIALTA